ncbi:hypothetical protein CALCODRAFT_314683 [Calocera cornea HHB12733]|uniref:Rab-GAP TBC domain-containing protein n=1 Tax=Calocera cornea HHB12733 TaxID=1353952 RepID=A0A165FBZ0_9BASI|nr:hypothetical protein CALCODRAFT_314683 [Calocera cornea HHB12733]
MSLADRSLADLAFSLPSLPLLPEPVSPRPPDRLSPNTSLTTPGFVGDQPLPPTPSTPSRPGLYQRPSTTMLLNRLARIMTLSTGKAAGPRESTPPPPTLTISAPDDSNTPPTTPSRLSLGNTTTVLPPRSSRTKPLRLSKSDRKSLSLLRMVHALVTLHRSHPPVAFLIPLASTLYGLSYSAYYPPLNSDSDEETEETEELRSWDEEVEAEAFWFLEAIRDRMGEAWEVNEAMDEVLRSLETRLTRIDEPCARELARKSLAPSTSEYSIKWTSSVLSFSLPPSSLLLTYDVLFALPPSAFIPGLVDVLLALVILVRPQLFAAGRAKGQAKAAALWGGEEGMEDEEAAKREGESLLGSYPIDDIGLDRVLRAAHEIRLQREWEERMVASGWTAEGVRSRLLRQPDEHSILGSVRGFAESFKQSDAAATLSKASTNWRASAMQIWGRSPAPLSDAAATPSSRPSSWSSAAMKRWTPLNGVGTSLPNGDTRSPARSDTSSPVASTESPTTTPSKSPSSPASVSRPLPSLQAALSSIINTAPSVSPLPPKKPPPRSLRLSASARPPSIQGSPNPRSSLPRQDSISSTASTSTSRRTASLSNASDSESGGMVRLRSGVSPRSPAGMALKQKREFSSPARLAAASALVSIPSDTVLSPESYISSPPLRTPPVLDSVTPAVGEAIQKWTSTTSPDFPVVSRSSSNSSLGSAYQASSPQVPVPSAGLRRNRRIAEKKPPGLRIRDPKGSLSNVPPSPMSTTDEEQQGLEEHEDSLLPYARPYLDDGERTPEPRTPRPVMPTRSPSPAVKRETKKRASDGMASEEEGMKADEEDNIDDPVDGAGYNDILSAYEEE